MAKDRMMGIANVFFKVGMFRDVDNNDNKDINNNNDSANNLFYSTLSSGAVFISSLSLFLCKYKTQKYIHYICSIITEEGTGQNSIIMNPRSSRSMQKISENQVVLCIHCQCIIFTFYAFFMSILFILYAFFMHILCIRYVFCILYAFCAFYYYFVLLNGYCHQL